MPNHRLDVHRHGLDRASPGYCTPTRELGYYCIRHPPDCANDSALACSPGKQSASTPGNLELAPPVHRLQQDHPQLSNIQSLPSYFTAARRARLPSVI